MSKANNIYPGMSKAKWHLYMSKANNIYPGMSKCPKLNDIYSSMQ